MGIVWYFNIVHEMCYEKASLFSIKMIFIQKLQSWQKIGAGRRDGVGTGKKRGKTTCTPLMNLTKRKKITQNKL